MRKFHLALGVKDIEATVKDYTKRLGKKPEVVVPGRYALWRTECLNLSVRNTGSGVSGELRHLGWEVVNAKGFTADSDCNGILWENFTPRLQAEEIEKAWPGTGYVPEP